jgi:hypothetical protein
MLPMLDDVSPSESLGDTVTVAAIAPPAVAMAGDEASRI